MLLAGQCHSYTMQMIVEAFPPELRIALEVTLEGEETLTCHSCWEEGGGKYRKREMRNELRCFMEPSKAIFCFKKNPNSQEQKGAFYAYSAFEMIPCILRVEKKIR